MLDGPDLIIRRVTWRILVVLALGTISACATDTSNAVAAANAVDRAHMFLDASRTMLALGPEFWARALGDLYFVALQLGRLKNRTLLVEKRESFHKAVWAVAPIRYRRFFSETLKRLREDGDYDLLQDPSATGREGVAVVISDGPGSFRLLFDDARENLKVHFERCSDSAGCLICAHSAPQHCLKVQAEERLASLDIEVMRLLVTHLPAKLASATDKDRARGDQ